MSSGPIEELSVPFDPRPAEEKLHRRRRLFRSRLIGLAITVVVLVLLYLWRRTELTGAGVGVGVLFGVVLAVSLGWLLVSLLGYLRAKRELASVGQGIAVKIDRAGIEVVGVRVPWHQVTELAAVGGGLGKGPLFQVSRVGAEPLQVPFEQLSGKPATLDMVARAYSGGRHGVDLSALDS